MKGILITAASSNMGKTTVALALNRALSNRGLSVAPYKCGPDYIDTALHSLAARAEAGNLDLFLMGREGVWRAIDSSSADIAVIEGVMGYFDGIANTSQNSSYDISCELNVPAVLVYEPKGEMFTMIPKILGMVHHCEGRICGIILNKVHAKAVPLLRAMIEEHTNLVFLGYLEKDEALALQSDGLGLAKLPEDAAERYLEAAADALERTVDVERILDLMTAIARPDITALPSRNLRIAVARDAAFSFYYRDNLHYLSNNGTLTFFSPLEDAAAPDADLIYLGGGYPERFHKELSENASMRRSLRNYVENGSYLIAEGSALLYLSGSLEGSPMTDIFEGEGRITDRLQRFGYVEMTLRNDTSLGKKGTVLRGHEYHKTAAVMHEVPLLDISKPLRSDVKWQCGFGENNALAFFQQIHFYGNLDAMEHLLDQVQMHSRKEGL